MDGGSAWADAAGAPYRVFGTDAVGAPDRAFGADAAGAPYRAFGADAVGAPYRVFGTARLDPPADGSAAAIAIAARDGFADPPAVAVRTDVLAAVGGPEPVRAGALADLAARIEAAGHTVELRATAVPPRRATPAALLREGSGRFWLFRRHPDRFPLPRPSRTRPLRYALLALGALHANGARPRG